MQLRQRFSGHKHRGGGAWGLPTPRVCSVTAKTMSNKTKMDNYLVENITKLPPPQQNNSSFLCELEIRLFNMILRRSLLLLSVNSIVHAQDGEAGLCRNQRTISFLRLSFSGLRCIHMRFYPVYFCETPCTHTLRHDYCVFDVRTLRLRMVCSSNSKCTSAPACCRMLHYPAITPTLYLCRDALLFARAQRTTCDQHRLSGGRDADDVQGHCRRGARPVLHAHSRPGGPIQVISKQLVHS